MRNSKTGLAGLRRWSSITLTVPPSNLPRGLQEEFARVSGLHRTYVGQIERGEKNISFANLLKISGELGVTMSDFVAGLGRQHLA